MNLAQPKMQNGAGRDNTQQECRVSVLDVETRRCKMWALRCMYVVFGLFAG